MTNVVGEIAIDVTADIGPLVKEMDRVKATLGRVDQIAGATARGFERIGSTATRLGKRLSVVSAGIAAMATGALAFTKSAADMGDAIDNAARAAGMGAEAYQEYAFALGEAADMSREEVDAAFVRLNRTIGEAAEGSKTAAAALAKLGFSQEQIASGSVGSEQALAAFVARVEGMEDPAAAAALATDLFGKAGARMGGILAGQTGAVDGFIDRARALGIVVSDDFVKQSATFNDKMSELGRQFEMAKVKIAEVLLPVINNQLIPALQDRVIPAFVAVAEKVGDVIRWFGDLPPGVQEVVGAFTAAFAVGGPVLLAIGATSSAIGAIVAATGPIGLLIGAAALLTTAWVAWGDDFKGAIGKAIDYVTGKFDAIIGKVEAIITKIGEWMSALTGAISISDAELSRIGALNAADRAVWSPEAIARGTPDVAGGGGGYTIGAETANGMIDGFRDKTVERQPELMEILDSIPQLARDRLQIHSPSQVFHEIGANIGQGLANGIAATQGLTQAAVAATADGAVASTENMASQILGALGSLFNGNKKIAAAQALVNAWAGATEALKLPFPQNIAAFAKVLGTGLNAVKNIQKASPGGASGGSGGGGAATAATPAPMPVQNVNIQWMGDSAGYKSVGQLVDALNDGARRGYRINATLVQGGA